MSKETLARSPESRELELGALEALRQSLETAPANSVVMLGIYETDPNHPVLDYSDKRFIDDHIGWQDGENIGLDTSEFLLPLERAEITILPSHDPEVMIIFIKNVVELGQKTQKNPQFLSRSTHFHYSQAGCVWRLSEHQARGIRVESILPSLKHPEPA